MENKTFTPINQNINETDVTKKKKPIIIGIVALVVIVVSIIIFTRPSKFEKVEDECVQIAGTLSTGKDYFTIDTIPDDYASLSDAVRTKMLMGQQERSLEAIKYANDELGFSGSVYQEMLETTALMGRQSEETKKYKVSWTYHPDDGLEATYTKK